MRTEVFKVFKLIATTERFSEKLAVLELGDTTNADVFGRSDWFATKIDDFLVDERA